MQGELKQTTSISIHVPREGDDPQRDRDRRRLSRISIHVPREGDDGQARRALDQFVVFLSTSPARGTTAVFWLPG